MRRFVLFFVISSLLMASKSYKLQWPEKYTFARYLEDNNASSVLCTISPEDIEYVADIQKGEKFYELRGSGGELLQALIPLGDEMQIELVRQKNGGYRFDIIPMICRNIRDKVSILAGESLHKSIVGSTGNSKMPFMIGRMFKNNTFFRKIRPTDNIAFIYKQKERLGEPVGKPRIKAVLIKMHNKEHFAFLDRDGKVYKGTHKTIFYKDKELHPFSYTTIKKIKTRKFRMPVDRPRITSRFSYRRWHPILHKYRPHFGVDFGARRGTPVRSINDGKVIYAGWMRGYGKVVKISHGNGFVSLYAHQSKISVKAGQRVKRGQTIGRVGSTGRSTGPHLHLGLYRNNRPVNPLKYISRKGTGGIRIIKKKHTVMKKILVTKRRQVEIKAAKLLKKELERISKKPSTTTHAWIRSVHTMIHVDDIVVDKKPAKEADDG